MAMLDRSRPYAEIWGNGLQWLEQDGRRFNHRGEPLDPDAPAPRKAALAAAPAATAPKTPGGDLAGQSDADLRVLLEIAGGTWTTREAALKALADA